MHGRPAAHSQHGKESRAPPPPPRRHVPNAPAADTHPLCFPWRAQELANSSEKAANNDHAAPAEHQWVSCSAASNAASPRATAQLATVSGVAIAVTSATLRPTTPRAAARIATKFAAAV